MPANDKLPPGSLVLSQGNLPGGQLCLALPSQLPAQALVSHPPIQQHTSAAAAAFVDDSSAAVMTEPAPSGQEEVSAHFSSHLANSVDGAASPHAAAAAGQSVQKVSHGECLRGRNQATHTTAVMHARGQQVSACGTTAEPQCTGVNDLGTDAVSMTASEGTSVLGELLLL